MSGTSVVQLHLPPSRVCLTEFHTRTLYTGSNRERNEALFQGMFGRRCDSMRVCWYMCVCIIDVATVTAIDSASSRLMQKISPGSIKKVNRRQIAIAHLVRKVRAPWDVALLSLLQQCYLLIGKFNLACFPCKSSLYTWFGVMIPTFAYSLRDILYVMITLSSCDLSVYK